MEFVHGGAYHLVGLLWCPLMHPVQNGSSRVGQLVSQLLQRVRVEIPVSGLDISYKGGGREESNLVRKGPSQPGQDQGEGQRLLRIGTETTDEFWFMQKHGPDLKGFVTGSSKRYSTARTLIACPVSFRNESPVKKAGGKRSSMPKESLF